MNNTSSVILASSDAAKSASGLSCLMPGPIGNWGSGEALSCNGNDGATDEFAGVEEGFALWDRSG